MGVLDIIDSGDPVQNQVAFLVQKYSESVRDRQQSGQSKLDYQQSPVQQSRQSQNVNMTSSENMDDEKLENFNPTYLSERGQSGHQTQLHSMPSKNDGVVTIAIRRALMCVDDENWSKVCKSGTVNLCVDSQQMIWIQSKKGAIHFKHHVPKYNVSGFAKDDEKLWCRWKVQDDLIQGHQDFWCHIVFKTKDELDTFINHFITASKS